MSAAVEEGESELGIGDGRRAILIAHGREVDELLRVLVGRRGRRVRCP